MFTIRCEIMGSYGCGPLVLDAPAVFAQILEVCSNEILVLVDIKPEVERVLFPFSLPAGRGSTNTDPRADMCSWTGPPAESAAGLACETEA